jgi:peptide/nickel transport system ATP-binding protein
MPSLLSLDDVRYAYPSGRGFFGARRQTLAVAGVSLSIERGRTLGLVGESGCGKSTTGQLALGLIAPQSGAVAFDGVAMPEVGTAPWRGLRARMQLVFQDPLGALDRRLTIGEQIAEPLIIHHRGAADERRQRVGELLRAVGLPQELAARYPQQLSGGQRQRAVLARALATQPELLVCDEPVAALDVSIQAQIVNLLSDLQADFGLAILFISHDLRLVRLVAHEVAVMYLGRIVEQGEPVATFAAPAHPYTRALLAAVPNPARRGPRMLLGGEPPDPAARPPPGCPFHPRCPIAEPVCRREIPPLRTRGDGRRVACHLAH